MYVDVLDFLARVHSGCKATWNTARDDIRSTETAGRVCTVICRRQHDGYHWTRWLCFGFEQWL